MISARCRAREYDAPCLFTLRHARHLALPLTLPYCRDNIRYDVNDDALQASLAQDAMRHAAMPIRYTSVFFARTSGHIHRLRHADIADYAQEC